MVIDKSTLLKKVNKLERDAREMAKGSKCLLCGEPCTSFCNSHSIPKMILRNIAENGYVNDMNLILQLPTQDIDKGIKRTGTFSNICKKCDREWFKDYENIDNLINNITDKLLSEIAIKNMLHMLYKRKFEMALFNANFDIRS